MPNEWTNLEHALDYLERADGIPHRTEGEAALLDEIPVTAQRILDLGTGDGRLLSLILRKCRNSSGVGLDFSPTMLEKARARFSGERRVNIVEHDLASSLPDLGTFNAVVSSFAIHHLSDERKYELYREVWQRLVSGGVFCNLEHVSSPTVSLHVRFLDALGMKPEEEDPSNKLVDVETQLGWLRDIGFQDVDCIWKWRELALLCGARAGPR